MNESRSGESARWSTAWGLGGVFGPLIAGRIADSTGSYTLAYYIAAGLMLAAAGLTFITKKPTVS